MCIRDRLYIDWISMENMAGIAILASSGPIGMVPIFCEDEMLFSILESIPPLSLRKNHRAAHKAAL